MRSVTRVNALRPDDSSHLSIPGYTHTYMHLHTYIHTHIQIHTDTHTHTDVYAHTLNKENMNTILLLLLAFC